MSDLASSLRTKINTAMQEFGSVRTAVTYSSVEEYNPTTDYNAVTGTVTLPVDSTHSLYVIFLKSETKAIFPALSLSVEPKKEDFLTKSSGEVFRVAEVRYDSAKATYVLELGKKDE